MKFSISNLKVAMKIRYYIQMSFKNYQVLQMYSIQQEHAWFN